MPRDSLSLWCSIALPSFQHISPDMRIICPCSVLWVNFEGVYLLHVYNSSGLLKWHCGHEIVAHLPVQWASKKRVTVNGTKPRQKTSKLTVCVCPDMYLTSVVIGSMPTKVYLREVGCGMLVLSWWNSSKRLFSTSITCNPIDLGAYETTITVFFNSQDYVLHVCKNSGAY